MQILTFFSPLIILLLSAAVIFIGDLAVPRKKAWQPYLAVLGSLGSFLLGLVLLLEGDYQPEVVLRGTIRIDSLSLFFQIFAAGVIGLVAVISREYLQDRSPFPGEFYTLLLLTGVAVGLLAAAADLIMIFISFEMLSITSYILTGYLRHDPRSSEAAIKYFLYGAVASAVLLYGMSLLYGAVGSTSLSALGQIPDAAGSSLTGVFYPALVFLMVGFGYKIAAVPFHQWSPDAYQGAPTPVTAFLSVGSVAAGFAVIIRVLAIALPQFRSDWAAILSAMAMMTMTLGNLVAISQKDVKRMLAYSGIAHAGYILIGLISWVPGGEGAFNGINGLLVYLLVYLFANLGAFSVVIALEQAIGSNRIEDFGGLMGRSPVLAGTMAVFLLSLTGIPATGGFIGKLLVFGAALKQEYYVLALVAIVNSVIAGYYYLNVIRYMFFQPAQEGESRLQPSPLLTSAVVTACFFTLLAGLYAQPFIDLVRISAVP